jgi:hypothetical protein
MDYKIFDDMIYIIDMNTFSKGYYLYTRFSIIIHDLSSE